MPALKYQVPKLCHRKAGDLAYCTFKSKKYFFGKWGTVEAKKAYSLFIEEIALVGEPVQKRKKVDKTIKELVCDYLCEKNKKKVFIRDSMKSGIKELVRLYHNVSANDFAPDMLEAVRQVFVKKNLSKRYIADIVAGIRKIFTWGVGKRYVTPVTRYSLDYMNPLEKEEGKKPKKRQPVPTMDVYRLLPELTSVVADMLRVQLLTAMRPSELFRVRWQDIVYMNVDGAEIPFYVPPEHKTQEFLEKKSIPLPQEALEILEKRSMTKTPEDYLFSPMDSAMESYQNRKLDTPQKKTPSRKKRDEKRARSPKIRARDKYNRCSYYRAIERAIERYNREKTESERMERFTPYQVRHEGLTQIRKKYGIEVASAVAGHKNIKTTEIYCHNQVSLAAKICEK